jgi:hypothetical protein
LWIILHGRIAEGTHDLFARRPVRAGLNVAMEPAKSCGEFVPAVTPALELGFGIGVERPSLGPIALLRQSVRLLKQIGGGLAIEAGEAQQDEHKQGYGVAGKDCPASDTCSVFGTPSDEDHSSLSALYAARIGQRDKRFQKMLSNFTESFSGPGVAPEGTREFQNSASFFCLSSSSFWTFVVSRPRIAIGVQVGGARGRFE